MNWSLRLKLSLRAKLALLLFVIVAVAAAWWNPALPRGASRRFAQALSFRSRHVIAMPFLTFSAFVVLFLGLRREDGT